MMMDTVWWSIAMLFMLVGLIGTFVPMIPGAVMILLGAVVHYVGIGPRDSVSFWTVMILLGLTLLSFLVDYGAGVVGAKLFGATRLGFWIGVLGGIVGLFFGVIGVLIGPILGVFVGELIAGRPVKDAWKATWGTVLGTGGGLVAKGLISVAMIVGFFWSLFL